MSRHRVKRTSVAAVLSVLMLFASLAAMCNEYSIKVVNDTSQAFSLGILQVSEKHGLITRKRVALVPGQAMTAEEGSVGSTIVVRLDPLPSGAPLCIPIPDSYWRLLVTVTASSAVPCDMPPAHQ